MASDYKRFKIPSRIPYERNTHPTPFSCAAAAAAVSDARKTKTFNICLAGGHNTHGIPHPHLPLPCQNKRFYSYYEYLCRIICI